MKLLSTLLLIYLGLVGSEKISVPNYLNEEEKQQLLYMIQKEIGNFTDLESSNPVLQQSTSTQLNITTQMKTYTEKKCLNQKINNNSVELIGSITENVVTFREVLLRGFLGNIHISPSPDLNGFDVDLGISQLDGITFHFNDNQMKCSKNEKTEYNSFNVKVKICVQSTNLKRANQGRVKGCFLLGGALLTTKYYDINTINSYNGMTGVALDLGCYNASNNDIIYFPSDNNSVTLSSTLGAIVAPLHSDICSGASRTLPLMLIFIIVMVTKTFTL